MIEGRKPDPLLTAARAFMFAGSLAGSAICYGIAHLAVTLEAPNNLRHLQVLRELQQQAASGDRISIPPSAEPGDNAAISRYYYNLCNNNRLKPQTAPDRPQFMTCLRENELRRSEPAFSQSQQSGKEVFAVFGLVLGLAFGYLAGGRFKRPQNPVAMKGPNHD